MVDHHSLGLEDEKWSTILDRWGSLGKDGQVVFRLASKMTSLWETQNDVRLGTLQDDMSYQKGRDDSYFRKQPFAKDLSWKTYSLCANNAEQRVAWDIVFPYVPQCSPLLDHNLGYMDALCAPLDPCKRGLGLPFKLSVFGLHSGWCEGVVWWKNHCGKTSFSFVTPSWTPSTCCQHTPGIWRTCWTNFKAFKQVSCWRCPWLVPVFRPACKFFWANVSVWNSPSKINGDTEILYISIARYREANGTPLIIYI